MVHAFVMVKTAVGVSESLVDNVRELEVYDVLDTTASEMQAIDGVEATKTYISLGE